MANVMVIDDEESILDAITLVLEDFGHSVHTIFKGDDAQRKIRQFKPDIIFLDILMSGKDGRDICKKIKEDSQIKNIPIVIISAHPSAHKGAMACGANDFLPKPFETKELLEKIEQFTKPSEQ